jgi:8-oxo-dGTP pyrophosphatase MutT (NUDIX family)
MSEPARDWIARRLIALESPPPQAWPIRGDLDFHDDWALGAVAPAAVLIGLVDRPDGLSVLLTKRSETLARHTGQIALPGGRCDEGETPVQTAIREAHEEVGLDPAHIDPLGFSDPHHTRTGFWITPVVALISAEAVLTPSPFEVAEIFETPFQFLMDPANHQQRSAMLGGEMRQFYAMDHDGRLIWGVTAGIIRALYDRLYGGRRLDEA